MLVQETKEDFVHALSIARVLIGAISSEKIMCSILCSLPRASHGMELVSGILCVYTSMT